MIKNYLLIISFFILSNLFGAKPTVPASQLYISNKTCTSMTLNWTSGNGAARLLIVREDLACNFTPADSVVFIANSNFKGSNEYPTTGGGNYILYNGGGMNYAQINNLKSGHTYHFSLIEYNNFNNPEYLSSNASTYNDSTYYINYNFTTLALDSCERNNLFRITNTSKSNFPNIKYRFTFSGNGISDSNTIDKHFTGNGYKGVQIQATNSPLGCPNILSKTVKIFPKKVVNLDFSTLKNDTQYFDGNYFEVRTTPIVPNFPMSNNYLWEFEKDSFSTFPLLRYSYKREGVFDVKLITTVLVNNKATGCKDTQTFRLVVLHDPFLYTSITPIVDTLANNLFTFSNIDSSVTNQIWYFGDGDSSLNATAQHSYSYSDTFPVRLYVETNFGYSGFKNYQVYVLDSGFNFSLFKIKTISNQLQNNLVVFSHHEKLSVKQIWHFGDGDSSTLDSCSHIYKNAGLFDGRLVCNLKGGSVYVKNFQIKIIDPNSSITENQNSLFELMPNPAHNILKISSNEMANDGQVSISNALGQTIMHIELQTNSQDIDVSSLKPGMYLLSFKNKHGITELKRFIIQ